jgi:hypothetical protein
MSERLVEPRMVAAMTPALDGTEMARPRVSWSAIFAGAFVVIAIELLLGMLGVAVGLGVVRSGGAPSASNLSLAAGLWWVVSTIIAFIFGSYVAARLAGVARRYDGVLHGLVIWGVAVLVTFYLLTSAFGTAVSGAFSIVGSTISAAGQGIKAVAPQLTSSAGLSPQLFQQQAQDFLQPTNPNPATMNRQDAVKAIADALPDLAAGGDRAAKAKDQIINVMAAQLNLSHDEAAKRFDTAQARFEQARNNAVQTARRTADEAAAAASRVAYVTFGVMLLDAIAACIGGALASPRRRVVARQTDYWH